MSLPIGHAGVGLGISAVCRRFIGEPVSWRFWLVAAAIPILPDVDFLLEWIWHANPDIVRRSLTHNIPMAVAAGAVSMLFLGGERSRRLKTAGLIALLLASHGTLDYLCGPGPYPSSGVMLFFPFSTDRHCLPFELAGRLGFRTATFGVLIERWREVLRLALIELAVFTPFVCCCLWLGRLGQKKTTCPQRIFPVDPDKRRQRRIGKW